MPAPHKWHTTILPLHRETIAIEFESIDNADEPFTYATTSVTQLTGAALYLRAAPFLAPARQSLNACSPASILPKIYFTDMPFRERYLARGFDYIRHSRSRRPPEHFEVATLYLNF